ncbi:Zinc/iron permease [Lojkania enalia]|uniref:Zinc/iron permease n=1 Tax=Lojkania enalia TaxID=147567 RepID=A0A9P4NBZ4_9PLEO|nr:Zinc/iron permease [Didymosphaeria enalia]
MGLDNDSRGWIMATVSGIACTIGASVICVDLIVRQIPGKKNFRIENSNPFLSAGLSLSFGVMIFSSLNSMLPSAKKYLQDGGMSAKAATYTLISCFLLGAGGISIASRILHRYIPHSVVDCDHEHDDEENGKADGRHEGHPHSHPAHNPMEAQRRSLLTDGSIEDLQGYQSFSQYGTTSRSQPGVLSRRPSLHAQISSKVTQLVTSSKETCDENGQCKGYSSPCGQDCFKNITTARGTRFHPVAGKSSGGQYPTRSAGLRTQPMSHDHQPLLQDVDKTATLSPITPAQSNLVTIDNSMESQPSFMNGHPQRTHSAATDASLDSEDQLSDHHHHHHPHHHHVPTNVFLSIGLQTVIAIALHKIPEGFITYATNHANPRLGFAVFLALFIHNITEGFAMALPLYLAIHSRWKALFYSALLGGVSQPLGAGIAAAWFKVAGRGQESSDPGETVYGVLFAVTAGIMAMVGLQLFGESLELTHSRKLCFASAFLGMGFLGLSSALTA